MPPLAADAGGEQRQHRRLVPGDIRTGDDQRRIRRNRQAGLLDQHVEENEPEPELLDQVDEMGHGQLSPVPATRHLGRATDCHQVGVAAPIATPGRSCGPHAGRQFTQPGREAIICGPKGT